MPQLNLPPIILASKSPRRQELLQLMGIDFKVVLKEVDESFPKNLKPHEVALYIAEKKAHAFDEVITNEIVLTADTIVVIDNEILGKPENEAHAFEILSQLSGRKHEVITAVSLLSNKGLNSFFDVTEVYFKALTEEQINYY
ncbi:MAG: maf, partial [Daejeonella sp.]|nr:maf [Daejeonella sp.]